MDIECKLTLKYSNPDNARKIRQSLEIDNSNFVETELSGNTIIARIKAESFLSMLHTLEDYLSCLATAENLILEKNGKININSN